MHMNLGKHAYLFILLAFISCTNHTEQEQTNHEYHNIENAENTETAPLFAITNEEYLQYGANVAYVNAEGDTIIPFGKFAYFGTDTMSYYANVMEHPNDSTYGRFIGIDQKANTLFDLVIFDNGPDYFNEGLIRVQRNQKMGYANEKGEVVIPCQYAYAKWFNNGIAEVTFEVTKYPNADEHQPVESDTWFEIDKQGNRIETP
ncbi:MAG: WG repeat-containing protein [Bacteroidota bacterium]